MKMSWGGGETVTGNGDAQYLTVNILNVGDGSFSTRTDAEGSTQQKGDSATTNDDAATYEVGLDAENTVKSLRFYFFDASGAAVNVKVANGVAVNYADAEIGAAGQNMPNVEKTLKATMVLEPANPNNLPTQLVAVLNATGKDLGNNTDLDQSLSLTELKALVGGTDCYTVKKDDTNVYVMSSSAYAKGSVDSTATQITSEGEKANLQKTAALAMQYPVNVYVERLASKVRVAYNNTNPTQAIVKDGEVDGTTSYWQYTKDDGTKADIYVKFEGWTLTNTAQQGYLFKNISSSITSSSSFNWAWNYATYHRSFWAENPADYSYTSATTGNFLDNQNVKYDSSDLWKQFSTSSSNVISESDRKDANKAIYCLENAADKGKATKKNYDPQKELSNRTQVVIKASLTDDKGNALELAQWQGSVYTKENVLKMMKEQASLVLYKDNSGTKSNVGESDDLIAKLNFVAAEKADSIYKVPFANSLTQNSKRYYSYIQLTDSSSLTVGNYYYKDGESYTAFNDFRQLNRYLANMVFPAKVWNGGKTYFYTDIAHLGGAKSGGSYNEYGQYGVVRNHIYDITITGFTGLGTPVYDPDLPIIPQKPTEQDWYLAAQINILSWRVVSYGTTLDW